MEATYNASDNKRLKFETSSLQDGDEFVCLCTCSMGGCAGNCTGLSFPLSRCRADRCLGGRVYLSQV